MVEPGGGDAPPDKHGGGNTDDSNKKSEIPEMFYTEYDLGPFFVYIESTDKVGYNLGKSNNIKIARDIFNLKLNNVKRISNKGQNRIAVEFLNSQAANNMVKNKDLIGRGYKIFIPFNFVTCKGICRQVDMDLTEDELLNCSSAGSYAGQKIKILSVRRLNRKVVNELDKSISYEPTATVLFTFKGVVLPKVIQFYHLERSVEIYIPPVTQCYRCLRFGHTKTNCKGKERCFNCGIEDKHSKDNVNFSCNTQCFYCKQEHKSNSKICPEYTRQKNIKELMAFENYTFYDANAACKKTYISRGDYIYNPNNFPLNLRENNNKNFQKVSTTHVTPSQRRTQYSNSNTTKRSYSQSVLVNNNKKRIIQEGYNKKEHEECLFSPNARPTRQYEPSTSAKSIPQRTFTPTNSNRITPSTDVLPNSAPHSFNTLEQCINFIMNTSNDNINTIRDLLMSHQSPGPDMDLDYGSDY